MHFIQESAFILAEGKKMQKEIQDKLTTQESQQSQILKQEKEWNQWNGKQREVRQEKYFRRGWRRKREEKMEEKIRGMDIENSTVSKSMFESRIKRKSRGRYIYSKREKQRIKHLPAEKIQLLFILSEGQFRVVQYILNVS